MWRQATSEEKRFGRKIIVVPLMVPDFIIERHIGYAHGVTGGNFWIMCETKEAVRKAGDKALEAIHTIPEVVTPFDVCSPDPNPKHITLRLDPLPTTSIVHR